MIDYKSFSDLRRKLRSKNFTLREKDNIGNMILSESEFKMSDKDKINIPELSNEVQQ